MQTPEGLTPAERELELALRTVRPSATGVDGGALAYRLGEEAGRRSARKWQGAAGVMMLALVGVVSVWGARESGRSPVARASVAQDAPSEWIGEEAATLTAPTPASAPLVHTSAYARQRERSLRLGDDAVSRPASAAAWREEANGRDLPPAPRERQSGLELFLMALSAGRGL